ncbi:MAG: alkaline phosphatase family protein, partial [Candidatus Thiodiazotropha sp. (ex Epidulcina cf. delphinae)]|nr:alkaline phosphatase family protein [Candidatus Thiodiazotropha sp. (ex Epidulcina cf. delphinae)]
DQGGVRDAFTIVKGDGSTPPSGGGGGSTGGNGGGSSGGSSGGGGNTGMSSEAAKGKTYYDQACASCHGSDPKDSRRARKGVSASRTTREHKWVKSEDAANVAAYIDYVLNGGSTSGGGSTGGNGGGSTAGAERFTVAQDVTVGSRGLRRDNHKVEADGRSGGQELRSLFRWAINGLPAGAKVAGASITFNVVDRSGGAYQLLSQNDAWDEAGADWTAADATGVQVAEFRLNTKGVHTVDLDSQGVALVQGWIDGAANHGLLMRSGGTSDGLDVSSLESGNGAVLNITLETGSGGSTGGGSTGGGSTGGGSTGGGSTGGGSTGGGSSSGGSNKKKPKVLVLGMDGVQYEQIALTPTPNLDKLNITRAYAGGVLGTKQQQVTYSGPGWATLMTGVWVDQHGVSSNKAVHATYPSLFNRLERFNSQLVTASIWGWTYPNKEYFASNAKVPDVQRENLEDSSVVSESRSQIAQGADVIFAVLEYPDHIGHKSGFSKNYHDSITTADEQLGVLIKAIDARIKKNPDEDWLVMVVTDHGRRGSGRGHGRQSKEERTTFIASNKAFSQTCEDKEDLQFCPSQADVTPSALTHMGLKPQKSWSMVGENIIRN